MKSCIALLALLFMGVQCWGDSIRLFNDSPYSLKAVIYGVDGTMAGEVVLNARDASVWTNEYNEFGTDNDMAPSEAPYTVNWYCMNGDAYGVCDNIGAGATVLAQGCQGAQECKGGGQSP